MAWDTSWTSELRHIASDLCDLVQNSELLGQEVTTLGNEGYGASLVPAGQTDTNPFAPPTSLLTTLRSSDTAAVLQPVMMLWWRAATLPARSPLSMRRSLTRISPRSMRYYVAPATTRVLHLHQPIPTYILPPSVLKREGGEVLSVADAGRRRLGPTMGQKTTFGHGGWRKRCIFYLLIMLSAGMFQKPVELWIVDNGIVTRAMAAEHVAILIQP